MRKFFKPGYIYLFLFLILIFAALRPFMRLLDVIMPGSPNETVSVFSPEMAEADYYETSTYAKERSFRFDDGGQFTICRFIFGNDSITEGSFTKKIELLGKDISIRWQNYDHEPFKWEFTNSISNIPKATLFIETTGENLVISIPALYFNRFDHKTIENLPDLEQGVSIRESSGGYTIHVGFQPVKDTIGEVWYYKTSEPLSDWSDFGMKVLISQDLHKNRRFCFDGYYFRTYTTYRPYAENGFFRNAANFTGAHLLRNNDSSMNNIGYAMTKICAMNQNDYGFWETGPMSEWLFADYGIQYDFYDTRFSTDFARSLIDGYKLYGDEDFLERAVRYAGFLLNFADTHGYKLNNGAVLVPDYWGEAQTKKTHVSLNHQLAELNFLLELFLVTGERQYYNGANQLLGGIEQSENQWIMEDKNLKYAINYDSSVNEMRDYPYLTYNDLFETKLLLEEIGGSSAAIERLMASKKEWMDKNGITEYRGYEGNL